MSDKKILVILDIANNHNGSLEKGLKIINEFHEVIKKYTDIFDFGFKFQYRNIDTFIHPCYKNNLDYKYVKRFSETRLTDEEFIVLKNRIKELNYLAICTPFDEISVDKIIKQDFDICKIASCSVTDWPLLEKIATVNKPIIISTAGASIEDIDKVVSFFNNRKKDISLMHCVAEYPCESGNLQLNQIDFLKNRYPEITIGFSTHERTDAIVPIRIAISKGCKIIECHIDLDCEAKNKYSKTPIQLHNWIDSAKQTLEFCGVENKRYISSEKEKQDLYGLRRAVYTNNDIAEGTKIKLEDVDLCIPLQEMQLSANDLSKYTEFKAIRDIKKNEPILFEDVEVKNIREDVYHIIKDVYSLIKKSGIILPEKFNIQLSHHYGINGFYNNGTTIIEIINREYCKKLLICLPNQNHPMHAHKLKEEAFCILYGKIVILLDDEIKHLNTGDIFLVEREMNHGFISKEGAIIEEVSSTHYKNDSYYKDQLIMNNIADRKTDLVMTREQLEKLV